MLKLIVTERYFIDSFLWLLGGGFVWNCCKSGFRHVLYQNSPQLLLSKGFCQNAVHPGVYKKSMTFEKRFCSSNQ